MAHYVMSDLHGEIRCFHAMLEKIQFSDEDRLLILGDVVDRGPDPIGLLKEIMDMPNAEMLLGNHEYMMLQYMSPEATEIDHRRWNRNGNGPTLDGFRALTEEQQGEVLDFLMTRPDHLETIVAGRSFFLVHGFPGENTYERVWKRPEPDTTNPVPGHRLIVGHTPVCCLGRSEAEELSYCEALANRGEFMRIFHGPGFIDVDCSCGYPIPAAALACLRLEDMMEYYVK